MMLTNEDMDAIFQCSDDEDGSGSHTGGYRLCPVTRMMWLLPLAGDIFQQVPSGTLLTYCM